MSTTTMHFGPEWMRKPQTQSRTQQQPSPPPNAHTPPATSPNGPPANFLPPSASGAGAGVGVGVGQGQAQGQGVHVAPSGVASTYSALVSSSAQPLQYEKHDEAHPFRYSKEELLRIYKEGGGKIGLGLEVERWDGVVREVGSDPIGLKEMSEAERKLFTAPLNSDLRRRQSTDYLSPLNTALGGPGASRLNHTSPNASGSPLRERFGGLRRRDSTDSPVLPIPRKQSLSSIQAPSMSTPRDTGLTSPRTRVGLTPGFDGILNSGESWVTRRRASEVKLVGGMGTNRGDGDYPQDGKAIEIREEDEEGAIAAGLRGDQSGSRSGNHALGNGGGGQSQEVGSRDRNGVAGSGQGQLASNPDSLAGDNGLSINTNLQGGGHDAHGATPEPDPTTITWSYKDPSGQIQGPFPAHLMQKWYDDGYFALELPMKRINIDTQWSTVEELARRATREKLFLSPLLPSAPPPGLVRHTESPLQAFTPAAEHSPFNAPYQPAPIRNLRSSALDYLGNGSNPDSPSSSFGAARFGESPDPAAFEGRNSNPQYGDAYGRNPPFGTTDPQAPFGRRSTYDSPLDGGAGLHGQPFMGVLPQRIPAVDVWTNTAYNAWNTPGGNVGPAYEAIGSARGSADPFMSPSLGGVRQDGTQHLGHHDEKLAGNYVNVNYNNPSALQGQQYAPPLGGQYLGSQIPPNPPLGVYNQQYGLHHNVHPQVPQVAPNPVSPWSAVPDISRRPFEQIHPPVNNIHQQTVPQQSPWGQQPQNVTPWYASSQNIVEPGWKESPVPEPIPNVVAQTDEPQTHVAHEQIHVLQQQAAQQQQAPVPIAEPKPVPVPELAHAPPAEPAPAPEPVHSPPVAKAEAISQPAPTTKTRSKSGTQRSPNKPIPAPQAPAPPPASAPPAQVTSPSPPPQPKAWSTGDDAKLNPPMSLREIQEAEAKKAETRKTAERERSARAAEAPAKEEVQTFTTSWGLPTSQAGSARPVTGKDSNGGGASATSATGAGSTNPPAVWTNTAKAPVVKKTMKEIQEEEEKRKKQQQLAAAKEQTIAAAAAAAAAPVRTGYAATTTKAPPVAVSTGGAWTTVGPSGKTNVTSPAVGPASAPPQLRPSVSASSSGSSAAVIVAGNIRTNGALASRPPASSKPAASAVLPGGTAASVVVTSAPRPEEPTIQPPSHEFLHWLNDSLKGLNSSVNVEEIMSMLLTFPLDDASTTEIISDLIYANSTTLDGRRYAAEFINKRKTDAAALRSKAASKPAKPVSIADVVKASAQPKVTPQSEWGFKVVNKKKKGGRA